MPEQCRSALLDLKVIGPLREHRLKLIEPLLIGIVALESRRPFELRDARVESTVLVMGRAEISEECGSLLNRSRIVSAMRDLPIAGLA